MKSSIVGSIAKKFLINAGIEIPDLIPVLTVDDSNKYSRELLYNETYIVVAIRSDISDFAEFIDFVTDSRDIVANIGFTYEGHPWRSILFNEISLRTGVNIYSEDASFYDDTNAILQSGDITFFQKYLSEHQCDKVLEIACGTNRIGKAILPYVNKYDGIDLSPVMLKYSAIKTLESNASFYCKDMQNFTMPWKYDLIYCAFNSLQVLDEKDVANCLSCVASLLSENGKVILDVFNPKSEFLTIYPVTEFKCSFVSSRHNGHLIKLYETHKYDPINYKNHIRYTYKDTMDGSCWIGEYSMTQFNSKKMDNFIRQAGLKTIKKYGDYYFQTFTDACHKQIFILQAL